MASASAGQTEATELMPLPPRPETATVVVLGAGYAGLTAYLDLRRRLPKGARAVLVNQGKSHYFTTELHEFVAHEEDESDITVPLERIVRGPDRLVVDRVQRIDAEARAVICESETVAYDWLIVALGSVPEYYGVSGAREFGLPLTNLRSARTLRRRLLRLADETRHGDVLVVGGGLTGVQLAAEVSDAYPEFDVTIVDAGPRLMPGFDPELVRAAERVLADKSVDVLSGRPITAVREGEVELKGGETRPFHLLVWAGGVRANPVLEESGFGVVHGGRGAVDDYLRCDRHERVFAAGDCAAALDPETGRPVAPSAQMAVQAGRRAADNVLRALEGRELRAFRPRTRGVFASLGRREGVGRLGRESLYGVPAMVVKRLVEAHHAYDAGGLAFLMRRLATLAGWGRPARRRRLRHAPLPLPLHGGQARTGTAPQRGGTPVHAEGRERREAQPRHVHA